MEVCQLREVTCKICLRMIPYHKLVKHQQKCTQPDQSQSFKLMVEKIISLERNQMILMEELKASQETIRKLEKNNKHLSEELGRKNGATGMQGLEGVQTISN